MPDRPTTDRPAHARAKAIAIARKSDDRAERLEAAGTLFLLAGIAALFLMLGLSG